MSSDILPNIVFIAFQLDLFFFQPVGAICDGQANCTGEVDDELSGQRQARHAERCGPVSQRNSGIAAFMQCECINIPMKTDP